jgi:fructokinase
MTYAGVELGGTKCVAILAGESCDVVEREVIPTAAPEETLGEIEGVLREWKASHGFAALGIGCFGPIDLDPHSPTWGRVLETPKPGWQQADVGRRLRGSLDVPTALDTDVNAAALGEIRLGSGRGLEDFAYITVGTGVGVGLIVDGKPTRGFGHCELGHIRVARLPGDSWPGSCPYHGDCVEGLAAGSSLKARFGQEARALASDHPVWDSVSWTLAQLCHAIVCAAAPRRIAIGGGVMEAQPHLLQRIRDRLAESLNGFIELPGSDYLCAPELGADAGPLGAVALAMKARP